MKKIFLFIAVLWSFVSIGQTTGYFRYDTVRITKVGGFAELVLQNRTKDTVGGFLQNMGGGRTEFHTAVGLGAKAGWALTKSNDTIYAGGRGDGKVGFYFRNNYSPGTPTTFMQLSNRLTEDSMFYGPPMTSLNTPYGLTDATYQQAMLVIKRDFKEEYKDTANLQYGGPFVIVNRMTMDSTASMFGRLNIKKYWMARDNGVAVTNQFFPPIDTLDVFVGQDGQSGSSFNSMVGIGARWGYNLRIFSNLPQYPYDAGYNSVIDLQREASRTRMRRATGNGFVGYLSSWKSWQANITGANAEVGHYNQIVGAFDAYGSTDWNIGSSTTKEKVLAVSTVDTSYGVRIMPQYRPFNEVRTGLGVWQQGDDDANILNGKTWFKQAGWLNGFSTIDFNNPGQLSISPKDSMQIVYIGNYGSSSTLAIKGKYLNSSNSGGADLEIITDYNSTAAFKIRFYNTHDASYSFPVDQYHFGPKKGFMWARDSISFQSPAYKFAGMPTGVKSRVIMQDADGYLYSADTTGLFNGQGGGVLSLYYQYPLYAVNDSTIGVDTTIGYAPALVTNHRLDSTINALVLGSSGEVNTASNLGGGLANYSTKVGVDLRFNSFNASDFDLASNLISIDYTNGQAASGSVNGFLSSTDWTTFNNKVSTSRTISTTSPLAGGGDLSANRTLSIADAAADGSTKGAASFTAVDFNASSGNISIDYTNGQAASGSVNGFLSSTDWTTFNGKAASGANTDITSVLLNQTGLVVKGASSNALTIKPNETLSAARTLNIVTGDATRTLTFTGDASISGTNTGDQTSVTGNAGTATALQNSRTLWGQSFNGTANVTGSLTSVGDITGGANDMNITSGTGNSRVLKLYTTTSGGVATLAATFKDDQTVQLGGLNLSGTTGLTVAGGQSANQVLLLRGNMATASNTATNANVSVLVGNSGLTNAVNFLNNGNSDFNNNAIINATLTAAKIASGGFLADANGNELVIYTTTTSAVNEITFANAATGTNPKWTASGGDTDVGIDWLVKGAGKYRFLASASGPAELRLFEDSDNGTNYGGIIAPSSMAADRTWTMPDATTTIVGTDATQTLTNKRWTPRVGSTTSSATPTINTDNVDVYKLTAQAVDITSFTTNLSGTPSDGDILTIEITGTATRAITWGASFVASTVALPTTTSGTTTLTGVFRYSTTSSYGNNKYVCVNSF